MKNNNDFSMLLTSFLSKYLPGQRNLSSNTIMSYRDNFKLFIRYCLDDRGMGIKDIQMQCIDRKMILDYLGWLEEKRDVVFLPETSVLLHSSHSFTMSLQKHQITCSNANRLHQYL
jgi:site-specific recombinase XerD